MRALLIFPGKRPAVERLAATQPLALAPVLGRTLLDYWLDHLTDQAVKHVYLLASDRPEQVRAGLGEGLRWPMKVEVVAEPRELTRAEARAKYRGNDSSGWLSEPDDARVMDFLPCEPDWPLFDSYADWLVS